MLTKPKSSTEICYDYITATKEPGSKFLTGELYLLTPDLTPNKVSAALNIMEKHGIIKAVGRNPNNRKMFLWEFMHHAYIQFGPPVHDRRSPEPRCDRNGHHRTARFSDPPPLSNIVDIPKAPELRLSERLFELALELEQKGL